LQWGNGYGTRGRQEEKGETMGYGVFRKYLHNLELIAVFKSERTAKDIAERWNCTVKKVKLSDCKF
jgi:hypothetical protein